MIQVVLRMVTDPERTVELVKAFRALMLPLRASPGFASCGLCADTDRPELLCYQEEWQTAEDLNQQIRSSHYTRLLSLIEEAAEPPELHLKWIVDVKGLEYLEMVRLGER